MSTTTEAKHTKGRMESYEVNRSFRNFEGERFLAQDGAVYRICVARGLKPEDAAELVRRWNAFEEGGLVAELFAALESVVAAYDNPAVTSFLSEVEPLIDGFRAAIAKAKAS